MASYKDFSLFLLLSVVWGSGFAVIKLGQQYFPPVFYAALCFDLTAVGVFAYVRVGREQWRPRVRQSWLAVGAIALFTVTIYNTFFFIGQRGAPSAVGAIILSFIPIITAALAQMLIPGERFAVPQVAGLVIGLVGVGFIIQPSPDSLVDGDISRLLILVAAFSNALGAVFVQRIDPPAPTPVLLVWAISPGGVALRIVSLLIVGESYGGITIELAGVSAVVYVALVVNVLGYMIFFTLLRRIGAFEVSLVNYLYPITAAATGWILLGEQLKPLSVAGLAVIIVGFILVKREQVRDYVVRTSVFW